MCMNKILFVVITMYLEIKSSACLLPRYEYAKGKISRQASLCPLQHPPEETSVSSSTSWGYSHIWYLMRAGARSWCHIQGLHLGKSRLFPLRMVSRPLAKCEPATYAEFPSSSSSSVSLVGRSSRLSAVHFHHRWSRLYSVITFGTLLPYLSG